MKALQRTRGKTLRCRMLTRADVYAAFRAIRVEFTAYAATLDLVAKAAPSKKNKQLDAIVTANFDDEFTKRLQTRLTMVATDGVDLAMVQIKESRSDAFQLANDNATHWAETRGAELVKLNGHESIARVTRNAMSDLVAQAMDKGWSNDELSKEIQGSFSFSRGRADVIARTETAMADVQGNLELYTASSLVDKWTWVTANDDKVSDECTSNDGFEVALGDAFPSGVTAPPGHPNCRCDCLPSLAKEED